MTVLARCVVAIGALAACSAGGAARAGPRTAAITCVNPASGATWRITIDHGRSTVDSNPARIGDDEIAWRDARDGWHYRLDRKSGALTIVVASSTGGYFLHGRCELPR